MYRFNPRSGKFTEDKTEGINEILLDMGFDGLGMYYVPAHPAEKSKIGLVIMHCEQNYMPLPVGPALAAQGYRVAVCEAKEGGVIDDKFRMIARAIRFLKDEGAEKTVLFGHSGGATLMSAYQAIAEKGPEIFQKPEMVWKCTVREELPAADGLMLIDPNYGNAVMFLLSLDPAIMEEGCGMHLDPAWSIIDEKNGYRRDGALYSPAFIRAYRSAQVKRNDRILKAAQERLSAIESGQGNFLEDEPFFTAGGSQIKPNNRMLPQDIRMLSHTKEAHDLLHGDGSISHEIVHCVRLPEVDDCLSMLYGPGCNRNTVKGFLSSQAIRADEETFDVTDTEVLGVDWNSSYASPVGNIAYISVPLLTMGMTGSYEYLAAEMIYDRAPMEDKTICFVHGADHNLGPNHRAEKMPGEFGPTDQVLYKYLGTWMERFM